MLLVTSPSAVPSRATINAKALKAHRRDSAHTLVQDITTELPPEIPITEKSMEAIILKSKGPYKSHDRTKLMSLLADKAKNPIDTSTHGKDNAQLLSLVAIDLAKFHPFEPTLDELIIARLEEMEQFPYYTRGQSLGGITTSHYYMDNLVAALYLVNQNKAYGYIQKYHLDMNAIKANIQLEIPHERN